VVLFVFRAVLIAGFSIAYPFTGEYITFTPVVKAVSDVCKGNPLNNRPATAWVADDNAVGIGHTIVFPVVPADVVCVEFKAKLFGAAGLVSNIPGNPVKLSAPFVELVMVNTIVVAFEPA
jgi:hypothetical protein